MLKVGVTGGIGSGKSIVCQVFATLGIPVFNADQAARFLMGTDPELKTSIRSLFGEEIYNNEILDREKVAGIVFQNTEKLRQLNELVHPATIQYSRRWMMKQDSPYIIKEAAIFFESGSYKDMDIMIGVFAPVELRIERAMQRSNNKRQDILRRISQQMDEADKMKLCNYVITNDENSAVIPQVLSIHQALSR